jgi:hypothetical protein
MHFQAKKHFKKQSLPHFQTLHKANYKYILHLLERFLIRSLYYTWIAPIVHQKLLQPLPSINRTLIFPT